MTSSLKDISTAFESGCLDGNLGFYDAHLPSPPKGFIYAPTENPTNEDGVPIITTTLSGLGLECCPSGLDAYIEGLMNELLGG